MKSEERLAELRKTVILNAPIEKVWKAISTSKGIAAWWMAVGKVLSKRNFLHM